jgi:tetratricopeptide (TPR) repeat protein
MGGKERVKYLDEAAAAHRAALEVHTRTQFPQDWARAQANLAGVFFDLGLKTEGEQGFKYLNEAATKYRAALDVLTRVQSPQSWAFQQEYLGLLLGVLGERAEGAERIKYWNEAVVALRAALEIFTRSQFPQHWAGVQKYLASIYVLLEDWPRASEAIELVLQVFPNDEEMNDLGAVVYHDELFNFERSFALKRELVKRENDVNAQANFAESHFTTARFAEAEQRINDLLARPEVSISTKTALRALEIANLLAIQRANQVSNKLGVLIEEVTRQPAAFKVEWNFAGTRYFITHNEKLLPYRAWLERLLDAIKSEDRDSMMKALQEVQAEFKE